ncbi:MAG: hypothetical protein V1775_06150 [Bacteroidota bacterium]
MKKSTIAEKIRVNLLILLNFKLFLSLLFILMAGVLSSQTVNQLNLQISGMLSSADPAVVAEGQHLQSLVSDLYPTLMFQNGVLIQYGGDNSVKAECGVASLTDLYQPDEAFATVEIILIKIQSVQDLQTIVNLDGLTGFTQLKYLFFLCDFELCSQSGQSQTCEQEIFAAMIQGSGIEGLKVLYKVSIPS